MDHPFLESYYQKALNTKEDEEYLLRSVFNAIVYKYGDSEVSVFRDDDVSFNIAFLPSYGTGVEGSGENWDVNTAIQKAQHLVKTLF